ncbi:GNAT family N-acetyltransferase [Balamuthia mandrillaris]
MEKEEGQEGVVVVRKLTSAEEVRRTAWRFAADEGWNPGKHDAEAFFAADPDGFFVAELKGEPVGTLSAVTYGKSFGFLGLYVVKPEHRGRGFGIAMWEKAMEYLQQEKDRVIGLDGVLAQEANYRRSGFSSYYMHIRYQATLQHLITSSSSSDVMEGNGFHLKPCTASLMERVEAYDRQCFPGPRTAFLQKWLYAPDSVSLVAFSKDEGEGEAIRGYGTIRASLGGYRVGPLFADSKEVAKALLLALASSASSISSSELLNAVVSVDISEANEEAEKMAKEELGMVDVFRCVRMYHGGRRPQHALHKVFACTTLELG